MSKFREQVAQRRGPTLATIVRDAIEEMIVSGELLAGQRINESTLSETLGVSRGPIREACRALTQEGLVRGVTNQGAYVRELNLNQVRELYEVRSGLAYTAGGLIVERCTDQHIQKLSELIGQMDLSADAGELETYYRLNIEFHDTLLKAANNAALVSTYKRIVKQLHLYRRRGLVQSGNLEVSNAEHKNILKGIIDRDVERTANEMRAHVLSGWSRLAAIT